MRRSSRSSGIVLLLLFALLPWLTLPSATATPVYRAQGKAPKPVVSAVKPASGPVVGGAKIVVKGKKFKRVKSVTVGKAPATDVKVLSSRKIVAYTPAGFAGRAVVKVRTAAGASRKSASSFYTYTDPPAADSFEATPAAATVVGTGVLWVTGGTDHDDPQPGVVEPWVVGIGGDGVVPEIGDSYYLAPGGDVFPQGLAGEVTVIATQADGVTAITVEPAPLEESLEGMSISYSDPVPGTAERRRAGEATDGSVTFEGLGASSFLCTNQNGQRASFSGSLDLRLENIHKSFDLDMGGVLSEPYLSAWVRYEPVLTGKVTAGAALTCEIPTARKNAMRKIIPIGTTGATVSFAPTASFEITGAGTIKITQRSRRMIGVQVFNGDFDVIDAKANLGLDVAADELSFEVEADAGVEAQFGALDRLGIEASVTLNASGKATARNNPLQACVDLSLGVKLAINAFLDVWVTRWESPGYEHTWPFAEWHKCTAPIDAEQPSDDPVIETTRLPDAARGEQYSANLTTQDGREGTWAINASEFPAGLTLEHATGEITGSPTASVRDYAFTVTFTDEAGRTDSQVVRLYVGPPVPVGGGDFQATLTWSSGMDLDLHVTEPAGEHVYYGNSQSATGGWLDRDANAGCDEALPSPIENVYWPVEGAPDGTYTIWADVWSTCGATDLTWHLVVRSEGRVVLDTTGSGNSQAYEVTVGDGGPGVTRTRAPRTRDEEKVGTTVR